MYTKRQLFDAALKLSKTDQRDIAVELRVSQQMVSAVLSGRATSERIQKAIDYFTYTQLSNFISHCNQYGLANNFNLGIMP